MRMVSTLKLSAAAMSTLKWLSARVTLASSEPGAEIVAGPTKWTVAKAALAAMESAQLAPLSKM